VLPAAHSWAVRDLHRLLAEHTASGRRVLTHLNNPIAYLSWLLNQVDLTNRLCAMDDVYAAYEADLAAQHREAHHQVRGVLTQRARTAAAGKAEKIRAEKAVHAEFITRRRGPR